MLLFKPEHVQSILDDVKIETRRLWSKRRVRVGAIHKAKLQMLSKEYFAQLYILDVWRHPLLEITEEQAYFEGGYTREEYLMVWDKINPKTPAETNPTIWAVRFRRVNRING